MRRHGRRPFTAPLIAAALAATGLAATGCDPAGLPAAGGGAGPVISARPTSKPPTSTPPTSTPAVARTASAASAELVTIPVRVIAGRDPSYQRTAFGAAWSDAGSGVADARNGCDTRNDVLKRDARPGTVHFKPGTRECKVTAGTWTSPYTGATLTRTSTIDIDHIVPLGRAWASGAKSWTALRRLSFANDPDNLVAADRSSNRSKGDLGPSAWRPRRPYQCAYAIRYVHSAKKWSLPISPSDVTALRDMLGTCPAK
ncbi:MAG: hypothetical protein QOJ50_1109 [Cryptosporangiaceae bacterium]|nr:hypothetical protein [Cryptosporangiaceae bacterium]